MGYLLPTELEYFKEAALRGSVNRAAAELRVAGSAVSRHIKKLERSLGVELFSRHGRGVELTEAGRRLLTHVRRSEIETASLLTDLKDGTGEVQILTVACSSGFSTTAVARAAARLYALHPEVRLDVQTVGNEEATRLVIEPGRAVHRPQAASGSKTARPWERAASARRASWVKTVTGSRGSSRSSAVAR